MTFTELEISEKIKKAVKEMGFEEATPVQAKTIPLIMEGRDVIGHSQTGTGKTAAFGIPAIEKIDMADKNVQVLVLCPTRELAVQACDEIRKFSKYMHGVKAVPIYGGQPIDRQIKVLKQGCQIVIGTPGRVMDHMRRRTLKLNNLKMIILDEADEMLNMGFREDIETILKDVPAERQTILFSATMSKEILNITKKYLTNPELVKVVPKELTIPQIEQIYYEVPKGGKMDVLCLVIDKYDPKLTIVFCNTKRLVDELVSELNTRGYMADGIHGDMKQNSRSQVLTNFKKGKIDVLVATDVAARGIDVDGIEAVINYDIPQDLEYYVHRIGRTGRAGKSGRSFTFAVGRRQLMEIREIQNFTKAKMTLNTLPSVNEVEENKISKFVDEVKDVIKQGNLDKYEKIVYSMTDENFTTAEIAIALAKMIMEKKLEIKPADNGMQDLGNVEYGMERLTIDIGKSSNISAGHIVAAVAGDGNISGDVIGSIKVMNNSSVVEVPKALAEKVLKNMKRSKIKGRAVRVEKAK